jgi:hypothetical protein
MEAAKYIDRFTIEDINVARRLNDHLFLHPLRNYGKGSFRVEKDREILH